VLYSPRQLRLSWTVHNRIVPKGLALDHNEVRRIAITAVFSDDYFFEKVALKGGNALAIRPWAE